MGCGSSKGRAGVDDPGNVASDEDSDGEALDGEAHESDSRSPSTSNLPADEPMFQVNPEALKLKEEAAAEQVSQNTAETHKPSQAKKQDVRLQDRPSEQNQSTRPLPQQGSPQDPQTQNSNQGHVPQYPRRASMSGDEAESSFEQVMMVGMKGNKEQLGSIKAGNSGGKLVTVEEEEILATPDPWETLQTQYQIARIASENPRKLQNKQQQPELVLRDSSDDEFELLLAPQPKKIIKPTCQHPTKGVPKQEKGKVKQGGWGSGALAAAGTLMMDNDDVFGTSDDDDDSTFQGSNIIRGEESGDELQTAIDVVQRVEVLDDESIEDFDIEMLAPISHDLHKSSLEQKMARLDALMKFV